MSVTGVSSNNTYNSGSMSYAATAKTDKKTENSVKNKNIQKDEALNNAKTQSNNDNTKTSAVSNSKQRTQADNNDNQTSIVKTQGSDNSTKVYEFVNKDGDTVSISVTKRGTNSKSNLEKMRENAEKIKMKNKKKKLEEKERQLRIREKRIHNREIQDAIARKHKK